MLSLVWAVGSSWAGAHLQSSWAGRPSLGRGPSPWETSRQSQSVCAACSKLTSTGKEGACDRGQYPAHDSVQGRGSLSKCVCAPFSACTCVGEGPPWSCLQGSTCHWLCANPLALDTGFGASTSHCICVNHISSALSNLLCSASNALLPSCPPSVCYSPTPAGRLLLLGPAGPQSGWWTPWGTLSLSPLTPGSSLHAWYVLSSGCLSNYFLSFGQGLLMNLRWLHALLSLHAP